MYGENVFLLPSTYDTSNDQKNYDERVSKFYKSMEQDMGKIEFDKIRGKIESSVDFGPRSFDWAVSILELIYSKLSKYYINGELRVWNPKDHGYDGWDTYDYPHKYNIVGHLDRPKGVYYLSDMEEFIYDKYGIKDELLYDFIIQNEYIEGRSWERVFSFKIDENTGKLKRGDEKYGMVATENINHILNIIELEFKNEIKGTDYEGFPIYIDYYKKVDSKY